MQIHCEKAILMIDRLLNTQFYNELIAKSALNSSIDDSLNLVISMTN